MAWAVRDTDPPLCAAHGGTAAGPGAPIGNTNALTHGYYAQADPPDECSIDFVIDNLFQRQLQLDEYIDQVKHEIGVEELAHLLRIHGQNTSRLGRLLRDRRALSGDAADGISGAIAQALDELSTELGVEL